jgi:virulence-associated protein VapD
MGKYYIPSKGAISWSELLKDPEKQWKQGYSAYELANCWEDAKNLPSCVERVFTQSQLPLFKDVKILYGFPEYKVALHGGGTSSQNDLYLLAKSNNELLTIMVEGKVSEPFGETVSSWLGNNPSDGKRERLKSLLQLLGLNEDSVLDKRYQLLHRSGSALLEAQNVNAQNALMLVHSFSEKVKWFEDYAEFVKLFKLTPKKDAIVGPAQIDGVNLYFGWVTGKAVEKSKEYFYSLFKTDKAKIIAKEIDDYIYNQSPYKDEVEDYHDRYKNGVRTDCIGYVSKKGSYKFATITAARKTCFILHLGKKLHKETAKSLQMEIDQLLGHVYKESDQSSLTPGEVYIRLEWVDNLEQITSFIDKTYEMRLQK